MTVMEIVPFGKQKSKVILDEGFTLVLYKGELGKYRIRQGEELREETYKEILTEVLMKRARERVIYLLKASDKTEQELRQKLKEGYYPQEAIDYAIGFLKEYKYIDDERYGERYVEFHSERKSRRQIQYELQKKGLDKEVISDILEEHPIDEEAQVLAYLEKKRKNISELDQKERSKIMAALGRKGFSFEVVNRALGSVSEDS